MIAMARSRGRPVSIAVKVSTFTHCPDPGIRPLALIRYTPAGGVSAFAVVCTGLNH